MDPRNSCEFAACSCSRPGGSAVVHPSSILRALGCSHQRILHFQGFLLSLEDFRDFGSLHLGLGLAASGIVIWISQTRPDICKKNLITSNTRDGENPPTCVAVSLVPGSCRGHAVDQRDCLCRLRLGVLVVTESRVLALLLPFSRLLSRPVDLLVVILKDVPGRVIHPSGHLGILGGIAWCRVSQRLNTLLRSQASISSYSR